MLIIYMMYCFLEMLSLLIWASYKGVIICQQATKFNLPQNFECGPSVPSFVDMDSVVSEVKRKDS
jgi:hypothetical protein